MGEAWAPLARERLAASVSPWTPARTGGSVHASHPTAHFGRSQPQGDRKAHGPRRWTWVSDRNPARLAQNQRQITHAGHEQRNWFHVVETSCPLLSRKCPKRDEQSCLLLPELSVRSIIHSDAKDEWMYRNTPKPHYGYWSASASVSGTCSGLH